MLLMTSYLVTKATDCRKTLLKCVSNIKQTATSISCVVIRLQRGWLSRASM